jgi:cytochrome c6
MTETKTPKTLFLLLVVAALCGALVVAGCGGGGSSSSSGTATAEEEGTTEHEGGKETGGAQPGEGTEKAPGESAGIESEEKGGGAEAGEEEAGGEEAEEGEAAAVTAGKTVFTTNCASCHTLKAANSHGEVGPNLDELEPDMGTVEKQVEMGGGGMPAFKGQLSPEEIKDVATFVSTEAGK